MDLPTINTAITRETTRGQIGEVSFSGVTSCARCKDSKDLTGAFQITEASATVPVRS